MDDLYLKTERPVYNEVKFSNDFRLLDEATTTKEKKNKPSPFRKRLKVSKKCLADFLVAKLPIIDLFATYKLDYLVKDFMSGLTVGIIQIAPSTFFFIFASICNICFLV
jgi:hypothetical protein